MPSSPKLRVLFLVGMSLTCLALIARCAIHLISHNYNISAEANGLYGVLEVGDGKPLYSARDQRPYAVHLYPPVYAFVCGTLLKIFGPSGLHGKVMFVRALSFLCLAWLVFLLGAFFLRRRQIAFGVLALTAVLTLSKFADYATASRNDMLSLSFDVMALGTFLLWGRRRKDAWLLAFLGLSVLSFYTRQTGIAVFGGTLLWLLWQREYRRCVLLGGAYAILLVGIFAWLNTATQGAFYEQVFLANLRGFRRLDPQFFDPSMLSFLLSYLLFLGFAIQGIRLCWREKDPELVLLGICGFCSLVLSAGVFMRAGGDVNYFFESILFAGVFVALALQHFFVRFQGSRRDWALTAALVLQLGMVSVFYGTKTLYAARVAFLPYEELAARARRDIPTYGYLLGTGAQNMNIHLRGWALYGPDVTNSGYVAKNAHPRFRSLIKDLLKDVLAHRVHAMVMVDPQCQEPYKKLRGTYGTRFSLAEHWEPWFCVYREGVVEKALTER
jgi:Dolichyl-phosphate-mannose-protein mannosyltransferase